MVSDWLSTPSYAMLGAVARNPDAPSKMDVLILSSLARLPMHGYEVKLELQFKHVRWWAKVEHGHLYAAMARLEKRKLIARQKQRAENAREKRVYAITEAGRRHLERALIELGSSKDQTFFDVDVFLSSIFTLPRKKALAVLQARAGVLGEQLADAKGLYERMHRAVPPAGRLIMEHRIDHLAREKAFAERALATYKADPDWGPMMGDERIRDFIARTGVELES